MKTLVNKFKLFFTSKKERQRINVKLKKFFLGMKGTDGNLYKFLFYFMLIIFGFIFIYPILSMISISFMGPQDLADTSLKWIPSHIEWSNYKAVIEKLDYFKTLFKTIVVTIVPSILNMIVASLTAYGFARFKFPGRKILFAIMLATFIIPRKLIFIPQYAWFSKIKLLGTLWTYILPSLFGQGLYSALYILILYSAFRLIPVQLEESASIDGASKIQIFTRIVLPLVVPSMITVFLFSFVWYWNDSNTASMYLNSGGSTKWSTLLVMLTNYQAQIDAETGGGEGINALLYRGTRMAGTLLSILPLVIVYIFLQRYFVESVETSGITGE